MKVWTSRHKITKLINAALVVFFCIQPATQVSAAQESAVYFVSPSDNPSEECSDVYPCPLTHALELAEDGDIIYFSWGHYKLPGVQAEEVILIDKSITLLGGWDGKRIRENFPLFRDPALYESKIIGDNTCSTIAIDGHAAADPISVTMDGFTITGGSQELDCSAAITSASGMAVFADHANITISHNIFQDTHGSAVLTMVDSSGIIDSNHFVNNSPTTGSQVALFAQSSINLDQPLLVMNNYLVGEPPAGENLSAFRVDTSETGSLPVEIIYNTLVDFPSGIELANMAQVTASDNIFSDITIPVSGSAPENLSGSRNLFFSQEVTSPSWFGSEPVFGNPLFVDPTTGDFHIQVNSAARRNGICLDEVRQDFDGDPRPVNAGCDLGADQLFYYLYLPAVTRT